MVEYSVVGGRGALVRRGHDQFPTVLLVRAEIPCHHHHQHTSHLIEPSGSPTFEIGGCVALIKWTVAYAPNRIRVSVVRARPRRYPFTHERVGRYGSW